MVEQYLHPQGDEDEAGGDGGGALGDGYVALAEVDAEERDQQRDQPNQRDDIQDSQQALLQTQTYAYGEGVDAGGYAEEEVFEN